MTPFEFVVILLSILFSIAIAHMLQSVAGLLRAGRRIRYSWLHAGWMLTIFIDVLANWLSVWELRTLQVWSAGYILFLILATLTQYIACVLVSPEVKSDGPVDLIEFHREQGPRYLFAFGLLNAISVPLNLVTDHLFGVQEWGWQNLAQAPAAILTFIAIAARPRWLQWAMLIVVFLLSMIYLADLQGTLK